MNKTSKITLNIKNPQGDESSIFQQAGDNLNSSLLSEDFMSGKKINIRRKSCCCQECGGICDFEKRNCHIIVQPRQLPLKNISLHCFDLKLTKNIRKYKINKNIMNEKLEKESI